MGVHVNYILRASAAFMVLAACDVDDPEDVPLRDVPVVFVGASTVAGWDFNFYFPGYNFKKVVYYDWDKTRAWPVVAAYKPRLVVFKESQAYFHTEGGTPGEEFVEAMVAVAKTCLNYGATPVLATTLPVDVGWGGCTEAQLEDIIAYNELLVARAHEEGVAVMDLYNYVADWDGQLPLAYHTGDGMTLNADGYAALTDFVLTVLEGCK